MKTLKSFADLPVTPDIILHEAENKLFKAFEQKRIRTSWQLRRFVAGIPGALGPALRKSLAYMAVSALIAGTWAHGDASRSWAAAPRSWK